MSRFATEAKKNSNLTTTQNGAKTKISTNSKVLDFYYHAAASRGDQKKVLSLFIDAYNEDQNLALKAMFNLRDIRGGKGERDSFVTCMNWLYSRHQLVFEQMIAHVPEYGCFRDFLKFQDKEPLMQIISAMMEGHDIGLAAKWLPSVNAGLASRALALFLLKKLDISEVDYRKALSKARKSLNLVERLMSEGKFSKINYSTVPSLANNKYMTAFHKRDKIRYEAFIAKAEKGEVKMNSSVLFPHDIWNKTGTAQEALWRNLPQFAKTPQNVLCMVDTSGSMKKKVAEVTGADIARALGYYVASNNQGAFKNLVLTFSSEPKFLNLGNTIKEAKTVYDNNEIVSNTNLYKGFQLILSHALKNSVSESDMPKFLIIISDMEFDSAVEGQTNLAAARNAYKAAGYEMPIVVFWNVDSKTLQTPAGQNAKGVILASGYSGSIMSSILDMKNVTPYEAMLNVLHSDRYADIKLTKAIADWDSLQNKLNANQKDWSEPHTGIPKKDLIDYYSEFKSKYY